MLLFIVRIKGRRTNDGKGNVIKNRLLQFSDIFELLIISKCELMAMAMTMTMTMTMKGRDGRILVFSSPKSIFVYRV